MYELCSTCLCKDRRLVPLKSLEDNIISSVSWMNLNFEDGQQVCWECRALFTRFLGFRQQALRARELITLLVAAKPPTCLPILSNLSTSIKTTYDETIIYDDNIKEELRPDVSTLCEIKEEIIIKDEIDSKSTEVFNDEVASNDEPIFEDESTIIAQMDEIIDDLRNNIDRNIKYTSNRNPKPSTLVLSEPSHELLPKTGYNKNQVSKDEEKFVVRKMSEEEMEKAREMTRNTNRYIKAPYKCVKCITGYYSEKQYNCHKLKQHSERAGPYVCPICDARFKRKEGMEYHHDCHYRSYQCRQCTEENHRLSTMLIHMTKAHEVKMRKCQLCGEEFIGLRQLRYHKEKIHQTHECKVCSKTFTCSSSLRHHTKGHSPAAAREECGVCGGWYRSVRAHMRTHEPACEDAYCAECDKQFRNRLLYKRHLAFHSKHRVPGTEPYKCSDCDKKFVTKARLRRHTLSRHTNKLSFYCDTCGKGFLQKPLLKYHIMEKHEGISRPKDKICSYCGKGFKDSQVLKVHIRVHTREKPYKCEHCPWRFSQRSALKTHARALHPSPRTDATEPA